MISQVPGEPGTWPPGGLVCAMCAFDIVGFTRPDRNEEIQSQLRLDLYSMLREAFTGSGIPWDHCIQQDRGDGPLVIIPPAIPPQRIIAPLPERLSYLIGRHNRYALPAVQMQVRAALNLGLVHRDEHGYSGEEVNLLCRMLDADPLKRLLAGTGVGLAFMVSARVYDDIVVDHPSLTDLRPFRPVNTTVKWTQIDAWLYAPDAPVQALHREETDAVQHGEQKPAPDSLTNALCSAWTLSRARSYRQFELRSEEILGRTRRLPSSTTQEILTGHRQKPPSWDWIRRFWTVLRAIAAEQGVDPASLGTLKELKELHEAACTAWHQTRQLTAVSGNTAGGRSLLSTQAGYDREVIASIRRAIGVEWWHDHEDVVPGWAGPYLSLEPAARLIHCYEPTVVPGLLQTAAYTSAVLRHAPHMLAEAAIARLVQLHTRRQQILTRPNPPRLWAVFDESVLRPQASDPVIMRAQIEHLLEISELPNVTIQVIPSVTRIRVALGYPITLLRFHVRNVPDVVYLEQLTNASYLDNPDQVSRYSQVLTGLSAEALEPTRTAEHLRKMLRDT